MRCARSNILFVGDEAVIIYWETHKGEHKVWLQRKIGHLGGQHFCRMDIRRNRKEIHEKVVETKSVTS